jgi:hypothetical protein
VVQDLDGCSCVAVGGVVILSCEYQFSSKASWKLAATLWRKPFLMARVLRVCSHSCSIDFLVCSAVKSLIAGS